MDTHSQEVAHGHRFEFGKNWARFLGVLNEDRIIEAENSLKKMLGVDHLKGRSFLDIGSGSGLFSLVARRLGASDCSSLAPGQRALRRPGRRRRRDSR